LVMPQVTRESASEIVIDFLKKKKNTDRIDVAMVEDHDEGYLVRGTCPIDLEGHPWAERFTVVVDLKGRIKTIDYALL
jgi:hypothetical protein